MKFKSLLLSLIMILAVALTFSACATQEEPPADDPEDPSINEPVDQQEAKEWWEMVEDVYKRQGQEGRRGIFENRCSKDQCPTRQP